VVRFVLRLIGWGAAVVAVLLLLIIARLAVVAHRSSPVPQTLTAAQIAAEDEHLAQLGLTVRDGSFFTEHPFAPPWTSHSLLIPANPIGTPLVKMLFGPLQVRADLLLADLDVLQPVMERAYGGWDTAAARGWDWDRWFSDWRKQLAAQGTAKVSLSKAFAPMDALIAFQRDNHTQIPLIPFSTSDGAQTAILTASPVAPCTAIRAGGRLFPIAANDPAQQVRAAKLWTSGASSLTGTHYVAMPSSYGSPEAVQCGNVWIPLTPTTTSRMPLLLRWLRGRRKADPPRIERLGGGVVYARLPEFNRSNYKNVSFASLPQPEPGDRVLIVDLRNNGGGFHDFGLEMLKGWVDESAPVKFSQIGHQLNSSCLFPALKWNYPDTDPRGATGPLPIDNREDLQHLLDLMAQPYPPGCPRSVQTTPVQWTYLQRHFQPRAGDLRIIALVNSMCASDCELVTAMLASLPQTIVAGTNTYGVGGFIQPGYSVLPHTGLPYRIALGRENIYGDNRSFDGYGLDVDVVIPQTDDLGPKELRELAEVIARQ
jgi:hypothetical protein